MLCTKHKKWLVHEGGVRVSCERKPGLARTESQHQDSSKITYDDMGWVEGGWVDVGEAMRVVWA